jgi:hypothetical protein
VTGESGVTGGSDGSGAILEMMFAVGWPGGSSAAVSSAVGSSTAAADDSDYTRAE